MSQPFNKVYPVLLAGGTGTRLWPVSRQRYPKQLVKFIGSDSLVQATIKRLISLLDPDNLRIVCGEEHVHETARHMQEIDINSNGKLISEPCGRNTAPAILLAVFHVLAREQDAIVCVFPADHVIKDVKRFHAKLESAIRLAASDHIVTFGIKPHYPETGYGYIEGGREIAEGSLKVKRFVEKPSPQTAKAYLAAGNYFWNSGMFAFKAAVIREEFKRHQPGIFKAMEKMVLEKERLTAQEYRKLPDISIDYAIMEKTTRGVVLPSAFGWSDIGSWKSLYEFLPKGDYNNVIDGDVIARNTANSFILGRDRLIATNNIKNLVVVETPDSVFVSDLDTSRDVKTIVENLRAGGRREYSQHTTVYQPWGNATVLEQQTEYTVNKLNVYPGASTEFKPDKSKIKQLCVISGAGRIESSAGKKGLKRGQSILLSARETVKIENSAEDLLCLIEIEMDG